MNSSKAILAILLLAFISSITYAESEKRKIEIGLLAATSSEVDKLSATAFGISLAGWLNENEDIEKISSGVYRPTFISLTSAFSSQIQIWRELKEKEDPGSSYMNQLILVDNAGFLREYTWVNHSDYIGVPMPVNLKIEEFNKWASSNLSGHKSRIEAKLTIQ